MSEELTPEILRIPCGSYDDDFYACPRDDERAAAADLLEAQRARIDELRAQAFYLLCHPEDAEKVAREMLGQATYERDQYGHMGEMQP